MFSARSRYLDAAGIFAAFYSSPSTTADGGALVIYCGTAFGGDGAATSARLPGAAAGSHDWRRRTRSDRAAAVRLDRAAAATGGRSTRAYAAGAATATNGAAARRRLRRLLRVRRVVPSLFQVGCPTGLSISAKLVIGFFSWVHLDLMGWRFTCL